MPAVLVETLSRQGLALAVGAIGAVVFVSLGMPLPWMLGPMFFVICLAIAGVKFGTPQRLRNLVIPILGVMLGSGFHPDFLSQLGDWGVSFLILPVFVATAFSGAFLFYWKIGRYDPVTAYFSSAPGGLNDMVIIGTEAGGNERRIALAHASRIFIVINLIVLFYTLILGVETDNSARVYVSFSDVSLFDLALLASCAVIGAVIGPWFRLPAPTILGPMILSGAAHLSGLTAAPPPTLAVNIAQIVMGTAIGCRFVGVALKQVLADLTLSLGAAGSMLLTAVLAAFLVEFLTDISLQEAFLAFSPGGLAEMGLLALALGGDIAFIATSHILRITLVIAAAPIVFKILKR